MTGARVVLAALLALQAGCITDTWSSRVEPSPYRKPPPEHLLRKPPDFRIHDVYVHKEFFYYFYADEEMNETLVTVVDTRKPQQGAEPQLATLDEFDYALSLLAEMWYAQGRPDQFKYFNLRHREEMDRRDTLLDQRIRYKLEEIRELEEEKLFLEADLKSRQDTGAYAEGDEKLALAPSAVVDREIKVKNYLLSRARLALAILEYQRDLRDARYARKGMPVFVMEPIHVADLVPDAYGPQELIALIRSEVDAEWEHPESLIDYASSGNLVVTQLRPVIRSVRAFLDRLRADRDARTSR